MLILMFVVSMMFFIVRPNIITILLAWDGLGLVSYCLVTDYQNVRSYGVGMPTVLSNRIVVSTVVTICRDWMYFMPD
jgi:NADH-ubiquinone oxidoreductase chain 5